MDINDRLYVEIHPLEHGLIPRPHPVNDARFDPSLIYKVLGMYNPSETSECYMVLANPAREIWFVPQRHLRAYGLIDSNQLFMVPPEPLTNGHHSADDHHSHIGRTEATSQVVAGVLPSTGKLDIPSYPLDGQRRQ